MKGNFLDLVTLVANHSPELSLYLSNIKLKRPQISFLSKNSQNKLIDAIASTILDETVEQIKKSHFFSIAIDSTFDVSKKEIVSFIIRFVHEGQTYERLLAVLETDSTKADNLKRMLINLLESLGLGT